MRIESLLKTAIRHSGTIYSCIPEDNIVYKESTNNIMSWNIWILLLFFPFLFIIFLMDVWEEYKSRTVRVYWYESTWIAIDEKRRRTVDVLYWDDFDIADEEEIKQHKKNAISGWITAGICILGYAMLIYIISDLA